MIIYSEFDETGHCPLLITDHHPEQHILIEIRSYSDRGEERGAVWTTITLEQAEKLKKNLEKWIYQVRRITRQVEE